MDVSFPSVIFLFPLILLFLRILYTRFIRYGSYFSHMIQSSYYPPVLPLVDRFGHGSWAVITGATNHSIGEAFAVELAAWHGMNVVLMSRNDTNLQAARQRVLAAVKDVGRYLEVEVRTVVIDFAACGSIEFWERTFMASLQGLDVSLLVNNVGQNETDYFISVSPQHLLDMHLVNTTAQLMATRFLLPQLCRRLGKDPEKRQRSGVISVSSMCSQRPLQYIAPYCASKAYNDILSRSLYYEFGEGMQGIDFLSCRPAYVSTQMSQTDLMRAERRGMFVLTPEQCVRACLGSLGHFAWTAGHLKHILYSWVYLNLPQVLVNKLRQARLETKKKRKR